MRTWSLWIVVLVVGAWIAKGAAPLEVFSSDVYYDREYRRAELPTGGRFSDHPRDGNTKYYIANRGMMWSDPGNAQKVPGLYLSKDGGTTWRRHCLAFEYTELLVHPDTAVLYAAIWDQWLTNNTEGYVTQLLGYKILMSVDERHWKDITGGTGHLREIHGIHADPEHPGRVRFVGGNGRLFESRDDSYSSWTRVDVTRDQDW